MSHPTPDLRLLEGVVASPVLSAMRAASRALTSLGIRHAVAGGLAVGAYGYPRATQDVDLSRWATRRSSVTRGGS